MWSRYSVWAVTAVLVTESPPAFSVRAEILDDPPDTWIRGKRPVPRAKSQGCLSQT